MDRTQYEKFYIFPYSLRDRCLTGTFSNKFLLSLLFILTPLVALMAASDIEILAKIGTMQVTTGRQVAYTVEVSGDTRRIPDPEIFLPENFQIINGPSTSSNYQLINGKATSSKTYTWYISSNKEGTFEIPSPVITYKGKQIRGNSVNIKVLARNNIVPKNNNVNNNQIASDAQEYPSIFLYAEVDKEEVFLQEPLIVTWYVYFRERISSYEVLTSPTTEGFWSEKIPLPENPDIFDEEISGVPYRGAALYKQMLFPTRTGELTIGKMDIACQVVKQNQNRGRRDPFASIFDSPFFSNQITEREDISSKPIIINVKPLPVEGKPVSFGGAVGNFSLKAKLDRDSVLTNESVTLEVKVSGVGNIGFLPEPKVTFPPDIESYSPETREQSSISLNGIKGTKTYTWLLIPRRAGLQRIPPVSFSYFDLGKKRYITLETKELELHVAPATGWAALGSDLPGGSAEEVKSLSTDIRWIHDSKSDLHRAGKPIYLKSSYAAAYLLPLLVLSGCWLGRRQLDKMNGNKAVRLSRGAAKQMLLIIKSVEKLLAENQVASGYDALAAGLLKYIANRLSIPVASLSRKNIASTLSENGIDDTQVAAFVNILISCDTARFTPGGDNPKSLRELINASKNWITAQDRKLSTKNAVDKPVNKN